MGRGINKLNLLECKPIAKDSKRFIDLYQIVTQKGRVNRFEAYSTLGYTPGVYERMHPAFLARNSPRIIYDKKTKDYIDTNITQKAQEKLI